MALEKYCKPTSLTITAWQNAYAVRGDADNYIIFIPFTMYSIPKSISLSTPPTFTMRSPTLSVDAIIYTGYRLHNDGIELLFKVTDTAKQVNLGTATSKTTFKINFIW